MDARYKTLWPRFWAGWLDFLILLPLRLLGPIVVGAVGDSRLSLFVWVVFDTCSYVLYSVAMHWRFGQTMGKMATKVKVIDVDGRSLSLIQAIRRDTFPILVVAFAAFCSGIEIFEIAALESNPFYVNAYQIDLGASIAWYALVLLTMLFSPRRRALHDFIAGTLVVRLDSFEKELEYLKEEVVVEEWWKKYH